MKSGSDQLEQNDLMEKTAGADELHQVAELDKQKCLIEISATYLLRYSYVNCYSVPGRLQKVAKYCRGI